MTTVALRMKPYIQPFERHLAVEELVALTAVKPVALDDCYTYAASLEPHAVATLVRRLAYWETIGTPGALTQQVQREATASAVRNGAEPRMLAGSLFPEVWPIPNRRALRYGPHGIHEYRGKFFPQLVRALLNVGGVNDGGVVLDPMVGSGTTAVEAVAAGCKALGLDMNPLSVFMARTKTALLSETPERLCDAYDDIKATLMTGARVMLDSGYVATLLEKDRAYLGAWFSGETLIQLNTVATAVMSRPESSVRDLMRLSFSNILRRVSLQKTDDLRIRRESETDDQCDIRKEFLAELSRSTRLVAAFLERGFGVSSPRLEIREGDARRVDDVFKKYAGAVDAVITSPPYATALPYLDTDRLSLAFLGLLPRSQVRQRDTMMIGNREITDRGRKHLPDRYAAERHVLPSAVVDLVDRIHDLNEQGNVGFRRRNLSALLAKYFLDMRSAFEAMANLMKPGAAVFVVVGDNHTTAGGVRVDINTADLLGDLAANLGYERLPDVPMEMLTPRDIHRVNSLANERILCLRAPIR